MLAGLLLAGKLRMKNACSHTFMYYALTAKAQFCF
jgi:hypothetical protein